MTASRWVVTLRDALMAAVHEDRPLPQWVLDKVPTKTLAIYGAVRHHKEGNTPEWHIKWRLDQLLTEGLEDVQKAS